MASDVFRDGLFDGTVAIVTGGGTGLGRATAVELAACGAQVVIVGRRQEVLDEVVSSLGPSRCFAVTGDIRSRDDASRIVGVVVERYGKLDVLVNNAGGQYFVPAEAITGKGWRAVTRLNLGGTLNMSEAAAEMAMLGAGSGTIVNVTLSPHHGLAGMTHSSAARAAVEGMTRELAERWGGDGLVVAAVAAGHFETEILSKYPEVIYEGMKAWVPLGRLGRPEEHAWLVAMLASPLGRAFNGETVTLDGGRDNWFGQWPPPQWAGDAGQVPTEERRGGKG
jgi:citronellol/citronellal dehydrogenase